MPQLPPAGSGTIALATPEPVAFAQDVTFSFSGTDGLNNPRVVVSAYQNGVLVYQEAGAADQTFKLGSGWSQWVENGGGPADCGAALTYIPKANGHGEWNGNGAQGPHVTLATCEFHAEG